jgi:hypothetical protein
VRKASAPTLFLVGLLVLVAVAGVTFGVGTVAGIGDEETDVGEAVETTTPTSNPDLAPTESTVTGIATAIGVQGAVLAQEVVAAEVLTPSAGLGAGARFESVLVDDEAAAITWDAGRPLTFAAATPLRIGPDLPFDLFAIPAGIAIGFVDGQAYPVVAGTYEITAPIAVTTTGLGRARESVTFSTAEGTTVAFTGSATTNIPPGPLAVTGPGHVALQGTFEVHRADGTVQTATTVELPEGSFRLAFTPTADGTGFELTEALLAGAIVVA